MIYQYDQALQLPTVKLYDTLMMAMALNAAKDMYEKGEQLIKDFLTKYADFMSPFLKDMDRYSQIVNGVQTAINDLYARGEDPLRSQVGRAKMGLILRSVNPAELAAMKANAKTGYAYLDAMQKLRSQGKYSEAQELFDIMTNGGTRMQDFATVGPNGFNSWDRVSPIEATTLRDLTYKNYEKRTPRVLNRSDFSDPRLQGYRYDPRYEYTGYLRSDLMKVAPGASLSLQGDPRAAFFREQARQAVIARGEEPTADAVERQFQEDIADANSWALVDPVRKADDFALQAQKAADARALENLRALNDAVIAGIKAGNKEAGDGAYSATTNMATDAEGVMKGQLVAYDKAGKMGAVDKEIETTVKFLLDMQLNPNKYTESQKRYMTKKGKDLGLFSGKASTVESIAAPKRISAGMEGVAAEVSTIAKKASSSFINGQARVNELNTILHDLSSQGAMSTINDILGLFAVKDDDGGFNLGSAYNRLTGIGTVMEDVLSKAYADGKKHPDVDKAIEQLKDKGSLSRYRNSWSAGAFDLRNNTDDWFPDRKVYPTGNVLAGDKYYYVEVSNDATDHSESVWFKIERNKLNKGGIHPGLSSITEQVDDKYLHEYSHTNVIGNQQSVVPKYNK